MSLVCGLSLGAVISTYHFNDAPIALAPEPLGACKQLGSAPAIHARAGFMADIKTGEILFEKNSSAQLPLASLTKLMTALVSTEVLGDTSVTIGTRALLTDGDSGLTDGESWSTPELIQFTLIESSNDGAAALAEAVETKDGLPQGGFMDLMNRKARALSMQQTYFLTPTGLDLTPTTAGAYGSARDVALLLAHLTTQAPYIVERSAEPTFTFTTNTRTHKAQNTSLLASLYPAAVASKTGYTDLAGGNLAFSFEPLPGHPVAVVVLGSTRDGREGDVAALADYAHEALTLRANCTAYGN